MYERQIFPDIKLFKKEITERFLIALREIYRIHPAYQYLDDERDSQIHIDPTYVNINYEGRAPRLLIKVGGYQLGLNDMLFNNASGEVLNTQGVASGYRSLKRMITNVMITVRSFAEEESSDLADELASLGVVSAHHMFTQVGINIRNVDVTETQEADQNNDIYETVVNFQIEVPWEFTQSTDDLADEVDFEIIADDDIINGYRSPGVYTFHGKIIPKEE